jgi:hypothetical protein
VVRSGKLKRKPFNSNLAGRWVIIATFAFSYPLVLSDTSNICMCAFTVVAPGVRFNAFAIFLAPAFCFAKKLSMTDIRCGPRRELRFSLANPASPRSPLAPSRVFRVIVPPRRAETALGQLSHAASVLETPSKLVATPPPTARDTNACRFIARWSAGFERWPELGLVLRAARAARASCRASECAQVRSRRNRSS